MNNLKISFIAAAVSFSFAANVMAQALSKDEYMALKSDISAETKASRAGCDAMGGNAKDICAARVKGKEDAALAALEARYKPTLNNKYQAKVAAADAAYAVAREKCDDQSGNVKDVCIKDAKAVQTRAKADAKLQMKTAEANSAANKKSAAARKNAEEKNSDARSDAAAEKRDADYALAREKCDAFSNEAKESCIAKAKSRYGKN